MPDRSQPLAFTVHGKTMKGFAGDTIGSALYASGRRVFSRSFKYHRPRGLQCCAGHCANCQMTVDGIPNVRVCTTPLREGRTAQLLYGLCDHHKPMERDGYISSTVVAEQVEKTLLDLARQIRSRAS